MWSFCVKPKNNLDFRKKPISAKTLTGSNFLLNNSIDKPSSVVYDHLSSPAVAGGIKPPFNGARRADALSPAPIGVASDRVYMAACSRILRWALTSPFHPYRPPFQSWRRYISVALALRSPSADVISYPALWCSDFPHRAPARRDHIMKLYSC